MADLALKTLQLKGKVRRFIDGKLRDEARTQELLSKRQGECNRCGACCKILLRCPFLGTDAEGQYTCRIYEYRFTQCRLFPLHPQDLQELGEQCSYTFDSDPAKAAAPVPADQTV
jgi:Fe-S-cluster containining protein